MPELTIVEAINLGLKQEMKKDKTVLILGEDVGIDGGVFRVTEGLKETYPERVFDTPLAESGIIGTSIGLAISGQKPIAEMQFEGFSLPAFDQIVNHAARIRNRTRGQHSCPLVIRIPIGGGIKALEHHSDSPESYFIHTPGLKVVMPSTPHDAKGLLVSAIRDPDPVIFFEPKRIYRALKQEVPTEEYTIPIGKARIITEGNQITLISYGSMIRECMKAINNVKDHVSVELIDLRTLKPLDMETIITSVQKTGRAIIVHEAPLTLGLGAELSARIQEEALLYLKAPIKRVSGKDAIPPLAKLEDYNLPNEKTIISAIEEVMNF